MMRIEQLSLTAMGLIGLLCFWLFLFSVLLAVNERRQRRRWSLLLILPMTAVLYVLTECSIYYNSITLPYSQMPPWVTGLLNLFKQLPVSAVMAALVLIIAGQTALHLRSLRRRKTHISESSIKEAIDNLMVGICCYDKNGQVLLKNQGMDELSRILTGGPLLNGRSFRELLKSEGLSMGEGLVLPVSDGSVVSLHEETLIDSKDIRVLWAADISEQYRKTVELMNRRREMEELNEKLLAYSRQIVSSFSKREILSAKVRLHDELGANLLAAKRYIVSGGTPEELESIRNSLRRNLTILRHASAPPVRDEFEVIMETAAVLGVEVDIIGSFPETQPRRHILVTGIHECMTNTLRHAHGNALKLRLTEHEKGGLTAVFTNNGLQPTGEITEGGGLGSLRSMVENVGGSMSVDVEGGFSVTISFRRL